MTFLTVGMNHLPILSPQFLVHDIPSDTAATVGYLLLYQPLGATRFNILRMVSVHRFWLHNVCIFYIPILAWSRYLVMVYRDIKAYIFGSTGEVVLMTSSCCTASLVFFILTSISCPHEYSSDLLIKCSSLSSSKMTTPSNPCNTLHSLEIILMAHLLLFQLHDDNAYRRYIVLTSFLQGHHQIFSVPTFI